MSEGVSGVSDFLRSYLTVAWFGLAAVLLAGLLLWVPVATRTREAAHLREWRRPRWRRLVAKPSALLHFRTVVRGL
jgi:hypothetical protein